MTDDLAALDALMPAQPDGPRPGAAPARRCRRHEWGWSEWTVTVTPTEKRWDRRRVCLRCHRPQDAARVARGRSARRLGGDQERRIERVYGPTKIGERGDPVDHLGRVWKWQSKATRGLPPKWLAAVSEPTFREALPASVAAPMAAMAGLYGNRCPVVIRSYVRQGVRTRDWLFVRGWDAGEWLGLPRRVGYFVIPGDWFLDHFGRDCEEG